MKEKFYVAGSLLFGYFRKLSKIQGFLDKIWGSETKLLTYDTISVSIDKPIFITGLARSGTTILLEILASHPDISTHKYKDYPFVHTNYFWDTLRKFIPLIQIKLNGRIKMVFL
ncbi:MAG: sulfotransferase [Rhodospirillales bacterium]|nr:sulfotransferase [Rhodospirillales bacterium]